MSDLPNDNAPMKDGKGGLPQSIAEKYKFAPRHAISSPKPIAPAPKPTIPSASRPSIKTTQLANLTRPQRLYKKFKQNPYAFFKDSKNPFIQALAIFYRRAK